MITNHTQAFTRFLENNIDCSENLHLTTRELEILKHVVLGLTAKRIGRSLNISHRTVEKHIEIIKHKFNCETKTSLLYRCIHNIAIRDKLFLDSH